MIKSYLREPLKLLENLYRYTVSSDDALQAMSPPVPPGALDNVTTRCDLAANAVRPLQFDVNHASDGRVLELQVLQQLSELVSMHEWHIDLEVVPPGLKIFDREWFHPKPHIQNMIVCAQWL